jgi:20S proteasome subunit alpha 3
MYACHAYDPGSIPGEGAFATLFATSRAHMSTEYKSNVFNDEGRILQVEYALKSVSNAGTIIAVVCTDGILLVGIKKGSPSTIHEKIYKLADGVYCAVSGLFSDCVRVVKLARRKAHDFYEEFEVPCPVSTLARNIGEMKQRLTQMGGTRPFGVAMFYVGIEDGKYVVFSTDPSGTVSEWKGKCYGENEDAINSSMKKEFADKEFDLEETTRKVFHMLATVREFGEKEAETAEVLHFKDTEAKFVPTESLRDMLGSIEGEIRDKALKSK